MSEIKINNILKTQRKLQTTNLPFLYKIYMMASKSHYRNFIRWGQNGTVLQIGVFGLQDHLWGFKSAFPSIDIVSQLFKRLEVYPFKKVGEHNAVDDKWIHLHNANFQEGRIDLLGNVKQYTLDNSACIEKKEIGTMACDDEDQELFD